MSKHACNCCICHTVKFDTIKSSCNCSITICMSMQGKHAGLVTLMEHSVCSWGRTLAMNRALCSNIGHEAFPTPHDVVEAGQNRLQTKCGLGYRAKSLLQLANQVHKAVLKHDFTAPSCLALPASSQDNASMHAERYMLQTTKFTCLVVSMA